MEGNLIEVPNYVNKQFVKSDVKKILRGYNGEDLVIIFDTPDSLLRDAKRNLFRIREDLRKLELEKIIKVIKKAMEFYYASEEDFQLIAKLTGSTISHVKQSIYEVKRWIMNIEEYLTLCFGQIDYDSIPIRSNGNLVGYTRFVPRGPIIGILPKNSESEAGYLMTQILLSKNPAIIKTSSSFAGPIGAIKYVEALNKAIDALGDKDLEIIKEAFSVVNLHNIEKNEVIKKLEIKGGTYVIFGSNETIAEVEKALSNTDYEEIIKLGTGLSVSVVFNDADLTFTTSEIANAAASNNGRDCISTNVVYVESSIYKDFIKLMKGEAEKLRSQSPLDDKSIIGSIEQETIEEIKTKLKEMNKDNLLKSEHGKVHFSLIELENYEPVCEFPAPILLVRKIANDEDFLAKLKEDLNRNRMRKNLATSVFTKDIKKFDVLSKQIPSFNVKLNKGTEKMNFLLEHQGRYLIRDFLNKILLEIGKI